MNDPSIGKKLFDQTMGLVQRSMGVRTFRHKLLAANIAHGETPGYEPRDLPFQKILEKAVQDFAPFQLQRTHPSHLPAVSPWSPELESTPSAEEVDIDEEMAKLAENNLMFQAGVQALIKKLEGLRMTISEGR